jgi:DNA-binding NtrC family response regulator
MTGRLPIHLLYVEDEIEIREAVTTFLEMRCQKVSVAGDGAQALELVEAGRPDLVVTDILMPRMNGLELVARLKKEHPELPVVITTAFAEVDYLLKAIELGVSGFVRKPLDYAEVLTAIEKAARPAMQRRQIEKLRSRIEDVCSVRLGCSPAMRRLAEQATLAAETGYQVVLEGEPGCGKSHLAGMIHLMGERSRQPLVVVPCAGSGTEQLETELFGKRRWGPGKLSVASGGTVVLQHVDQIGHVLQSKLAHALEERRFLPGATAETVALNARVIATVHGSVARAHASGRLCDALFYRLTEQVIALPPLREMPEDLARLAQNFLAEAAGDLRRPGLTLHDDALALIAAHPWPGNIRQLKNIMRRAALCGCKVIGRAQLAPLLPAPAADVGEPAGLLTPFLSFGELERRALTDALQRCGNKKMQAAELLGIDYKRFKRKLEKYGL